MRGLISSGAAALVISAATVTADPAPPAAPATATSTATAASETVPAATALITGWHLATTPAPGIADAIGGYSAGCIQGAVELPRSGKGYGIARPQRRRAFGHPRLISYIQDLGKTVAARRLGTLWVDDLAQARGGPAPNGHASHQTGLDVDLRYSLDRKVATGPEPVVDLAHGKPNKRFTERVVNLLVLAASSPDVDRIFVNPVIKRELCGRPKIDRAALRKLRPWWGHHDHFHVRLACPQDSADCLAQRPLPAGDGCDGLDWWFASTAKVERETKRGTYRSKVGASPSLPARCRTVLDAK
ncbi:MAG: penicillin-insensitive murein endopeptidase [Kofleriaceae bacterium]